MSIRKDLNYRKKSPMWPPTLKPHYSQHLLPNRYPIYKHWYTVISTWVRRRKSDWNHRHSLTTRAPIRNKHGIYLISHSWQCTAKMWKAVIKCQLAVWNTYTESSKSNSKSPKMVHLYSPTSKLNRGRPITSTTDIATNAHTISTIALHFHLNCTRHLLHSIPKCRNRNQSCICVLWISSVGHILS